MERGGLTKRDFKLRVLIWLRSICECRLGKLPKDSVQLILVFIGNSWIDLLQIASLNLCMANAIFTMPHGKESLALYEHQYETAMEEARAQEAQEEEDIHLRERGFDHLSELGYGSDRSWSPGS